MEDWPEDSPEVNPGFKPVRKHCHASTNCQQCSSGKNNFLLKTFQLMNYVVFIFFLKSGKFRLRRESLKVRNHSFFSQQCFLNRRKDTKKKSQNFTLDEGGV